MTQTIRTESNWDRNAGKSGRDAGMARVTASADDAHTNWSATAYLVLRAFVRRREHAFTAENVRAFATEKGLPEANDQRAWGSIFQRAAKEGLIRKLGYRQAEGRACHMHPVTLWRVVR
jgi:hypothetical protein